MKTYLTLIFVIFLSLNLWAGDVSTGWWEKFPPPKKVYKTHNVLDLPETTNPDGTKFQGGAFGAYHLMWESIAGLAAKAAKEGKNDEMVWIDIPANPDYKIWLEETAKIIDAKIIGADDPWQLVENFKNKGIIKGYILCRIERSERPVYSESKDQKIDNSVNVACSLAGILDGIIIDESLEKEAKEQGLKLLMDVREKSLEWCFDTYKDKFNRNIICAQDPKVSHIRDYAIAVKSFCTFGVDEFYEKVLQWLEPGSPLLGWNIGDEFKQTYALSKYGHFNTATNWCLSLAFLSSVQPGSEKLPLSSLRIPSKSTKNLADLTFEKDVHYTSFVMSDGDNVQWLMGGFLNHQLRHFWNSHYRGDFPFGWTTPLVDLYGVAPVCLRYLMDTMTPNDDLILHGGGGYYYPDVMVNVNNGEVLAKHSRQIAEINKITGQRILAVNLQNWESEDAKRAYQIYVDNIPDLLGIMTIQYYPYPGGAGKVLWFKNKRGESIPVVSAKYSIWAKVEREREGTPNKIADILNKAQHLGAPLTSEYYDWCIVHSWSFFKPKEPGGGYETEEVDQEKWDAPGITRGLAPVKWCVDNLSSYVKVVTPEELILRLRFITHTKEVLSNEVAKIEDIFKAINKESKFYNEAKVSLEKTKQLIEKLNDQSSFDEKIRAFEQYKDAHWKVLVARNSTVSLNQKNSSLEISLPPMELNKKIQKDLFHLQLCSLKDFLYPEDETLLSENEYKISGNFNSYYSRVRATQINSPLWGEWSNIIQIK